MENYAMHVVSEEKLLWANRAENDNVCVVDATAIGMKTDTWPREVLVTRPDGSTTYFTFSSVVRNPEFNNRLTYVRYTDLNNGRSLKIYNN